MTEIKKLLEAKKKMRKRKPSFIRQEFTKRKRLSKNWRRPRGIHSKIRLRRKGKASRVAIGYGTPKKIRHLTAEGLRKINVQNVAQLKELDNSKDIAIIGRTVGDRKKLDILRNAKKEGIKVYNFSRIDEEIKRIEEKHKKETKKDKKKDKSNKETKKSDKKDTEKSDNQKQNKEVNNESKTSKKASK